MEKVWSTRDHLNTNEHWKLEKDGLEILKEIPEIAAMEYASLDKSDIERLKWAGIYAQRPKNGRFLVRVKLSSGAMTAEQARVIAGISRDFGADSIQITIRQCIQVHNLTQKDFPEVLRRLDAAGLTSVEGCGDVPRNILGNPLMGIDPEELFDTTDIVKEAAEALIGNPEFSNLPRKYKISISANPRDTGFARINDIAFVPAVRRRQGEVQNGFHVYVGGGLSSNPMLAEKLSFFIRPEETLSVIRAVALIFRDYGYRESRTHCRLKFLVQDWGKEKLEKTIESYTGPLLRGGREYLHRWNYGRFHGFHRQKQEGLYYAGLNVPMGHMEAADLAALADLADRYGDGTMRTTNSQCVILANIPERNLASLREEPLLEKFRPDPGYFEGYAAACTGNRYCSFAPVDSKAVLGRLIASLEASFPEMDVPFRVNVTGCVHSCAHPQLADIGFTGGKMRWKDAVTDGYAVWIGGTLGRNAHFGYQLDGRVPEERLEAFTKSVVSLYLAERKRGEDFTIFAKRIGSEPFQKLLGDAAA